MPFIKVKESYPYDCTTLINTDKIACIRFHKNITTIYYSESEKEKDQSYVQVDNKYQEIISQL
jgi:hypothetical protein